MAETIFCISKEQREYIYDSLRGLEHVRSVMSAKGLEWEPHATSLHTYTESIAQVLNALPRDPRCASPLPGIDVDATLPCPRCAQSAGPAQRITAEGQHRTFYLRCQWCGHSWTVDE